MQPPKPNSILAHDKNGKQVQLMGLAAPQNAIAVNGSAGAAVLTGAITAGFVRLNPTVDMYVLPTIAGAVTSATGHFIYGGVPTDIPMPIGATKISALAVGATAGTLYLSELG